MRSPLAVPRPAARAAPPPWPVAPMLAKPSAELPSDRAAHAYEFKWDGYRTLLFADAGQARVRSRNLHDVTAEYPELQRVAAALGKRRAVLDGEVVVLDERGRPDFGLLQRRSGFDLPKGAERLRVEVSYIAFDLLWLDGASLVASPWRERRAALEGLGLEPPAAWVPPASDDAEEVQEASEALGLEGVMAKRKDAPYQAGQRTGAWLKVKRHREQEFVVGGFTRGTGSRRRLGALLLGYHEGRALRYAGRVGTGFTEPMLRDLAEALEPMAQDASPFSEEDDAEGEVVYVAPRLVCQVRFSGWTHDDHLRHPSFRGLRSDKDPRDVVREED